MNKKYRFKPTREMNRFIHTELVKRGGEISDIWDDELMTLFPDAFEEIEGGPVSFDEWFKIECDVTEHKEEFRKCHKWTIENDRKRTQPLIDLLPRALSAVEFVCKHTRDVDIRSNTEAPVAQFVSLMEEIKQALKTLEENGT